MLAAGGGAIGILAGKSLNLVLLQLHAYLNVVLLQLCYYNCMLIC